MELKQALETLGKEFEEFKKTNDARIAAEKAGDDARAAELSDRLDKIEKSIQEAQDVRKKIEREAEAMKTLLEELQVSKNRPGTPEKKRRAEYAETFEAWFRSGGKSHQHEVRLKELHHEMIQNKDYTIGDGPSGGFAVPEEIARTIERLEKKFSPVRSLVKVVSVGTSDYKELVNERGTSAGWVGETDTRNLTGTSTLRERKPPMGELYAYPQSSEWALDDVFFNLAAWIAEETAQEFAIEEGDAVIRGNGTNKPEGMLNTTPTTDADFSSPLRPSSAYQYFPVAKSEGSPATLSLDSDKLFDLVYGLNSIYRAGGTWIMNSLTTGIVRRLKTTDGQYLWAPGLEAGEPDRLLGYPHSTWEQLDDLGANNFPMAFGNFARGYLLVDRVGLRITVDQVTNPGFIRWYIRRREGGIPLNNDAIKWGRFATS